MSDYIPYQSREPSEAEYEMMQAEEEKRRVDHEAGRIFRVSVENNWEEFKSDNDAYSINFLRDSFVVWMTYSRESLENRYTLEEAIELADEIERRHPLVTVSIIETML